jgi:hypothetical protein
LCSDVASNLPTETDIITKQCLSVISILTETKDIS